MLEGLRNAYAEIYARSEYAHLLSKDKLRDMVTEITGLERDSSVINGITGTFQALKAIGNIDESTKAGTASSIVSTQPAITPQIENNEMPANARSTSQEVGMNLSYNINLNLPTSTDPEVFNAIFRSLKEHLLGK